MLDFGFYNMDCMDGMKEFPDNYFELDLNLIKTITKMLATG